MLEAASARTKVAAIEADLSVIMQMLRVTLRAEGYQLTEERVDELSGMVFAASCRLASLGLDVSTLASEHAAMIRSARKLISSVEDSYANIADLASAAQKAISLARKGEPEGIELIATAVAQIICLASPVAEPEVSNVVPFAKPAAVLEGGAA